MNLVASNVLVKVAILSITTALVLFCWIVENMITISYNLGRLLHIVRGYLSRRRIVYFILLRISFQQLRLFYLFKSGGDTNILLDYE